MEIEQTNHIIRNVLMHSFRISVEMIWKLRSRNGVFSFGIKIDPFWVQQRRYISLPIYIQLIGNKSAGNNPPFHITKNNHGTKILGREHIFSDLMNSHMEIAMTYASTEQVADTVSSAVTSFVNTLVETINQNLVKHYRLLCKTQKRKTSHQMKTRMRHNPFNFTFGIHQFRKPHFVFVGEELNPDFPIDKVWQRKKFPFIQIVHKSLELLTNNISVESSFFVDSTSQMGDSELILFKSYEPLKFELGSVGSVCKVKVKTCLQSWESVSLG